MTWGLFDLVGWTAPIFLGWLGLMPVLGMGGLEALETGRLPGRLH